MNENKKKLIKAIAFLGGFCLLFSIFSNILIPKMPVKRSLEFEFKTSSANSYEVIFLGGSSFHSGISPLTIWHNYGYTSYTRSIPYQFPMALYYYLSDVLKNQNPSVVVIDGVDLFFDYDLDDYEPQVRFVVDPMSMSESKLMLINELRSNSDTLSPESYLFPIFRYHSRWNQLRKSDFIGINYTDFPVFGGHNPLYKTMVLEYPDKYMESTTNQDIIPINSAEYYEKIIGLCRSKGIKVVFVTLPKMDWSYSRYLAVKNFTEVNQIPYLDLSFPEVISELGLDLSTDFSDEGHLNFYGAQKVSIYLGKYLQDQYQLSDKRNDPQFSNLDEKYYQYIKKATKNKLAQEIKEKETSN